VAPPSAINTPSVNFRFAQLNANGTSTNLHLHGLTNTISNELPGEKWALRVRIPEAKRRAMYA